MAELPTGTVTFLFTDLEGSTRLWEEHPDAMKTALARHDEILRGAVESHDGHVVKTTGDGIHAAFDRAVDAVAVAAEAQRALGSEAWGEAGPLRVRMGIHSGEAEYRDGDYYGPALNRAARVMAVANGGQILVTLATEELVRDSLPSDIELVDLGEHRLRDLARPERLFQVNAPGLESHFPSIRSLDAYPGNLPSQVTSFVGRDDDLVGLTNALDQSRLVTLTGAGGMGKTRLATQLAAELVPQFPDGAWLCELAPTADDDSMTQAVAATLGVQARVGMSLAESIVDFLGPKRLLVVLDNCEHVLHDAAALVNAILRSCPLVRLVATSRVPLDIAGEQQWPVRPLAVPREAAGTDSLHELSAVRLFVDRARAARPDFAVSETNADAVSEICRRLDGMPLALELAAARVFALGPGEIAALLDERFRLLTGGHRGERHQTLRAAIDWSYSLLGETEQLVFDRLGVFSGSFDADAARAVASGDGIEPFDVIDALTHLVEHSMVTAEPVADGTMRYELLETLREYALERLGDDVERWRRKHAQHYAEFASEAAISLKTDDEREWRVRIGLELDNLRAAVGWGVNAPDEADAGLAARIAGDLAWLVITNPGWRIASWVDRAIDRGVFPDEATRYAVYAGAAQGLVGSGEYRRARELAAEALRNGLPPDAPMPYLGYSALGTSLAVAGDFDGSLRAFEEGIVAMDVIGASVLDHLMLEHAASMVQSAYGDVEAGRARAERCLPLARGLHRNASGLVGGLVAYGWSILETDPEAALAALDEAAEVGRTRSTNIGSLGIGLSLAAQLRCNQGDPRAAIRAVRESVMINADAGDRGMLTTALQRSVAVLIGVGSVSTAVVLAGAVTGPFVRFGHLPVGERARLDEALERSRDMLAAEEYDGLWARGAAMALDELIVFARSELDRIIEELGDG